MDHGKLANQVVRISKMAVLMDGCIHIASKENSDVLPISENCLSKIKECTDKWKHLVGIQRVVAEKLSEIF